MQPCFVQLLSGSATFVPPQTVSVAPGVLVKVKWKGPLPSFAALAKVIAGDFAYSSNRTSGGSKALDQAAGLGTGRKRSPEDFKR